MCLINILGWFGNKIEKGWEWFKGVIDKYIGSGLSAMIITLILIVVAIIAIRKFTSR